MGRSITSANAIYTISIATVYPTPVRLQNFSADDIFDTEALDLAEIQMGADGKMSAGLIYKEVKQGISLQADSVSNLIFENWYRQQRVAVDVFFASGLITLPSVNRKYTMHNGVLMSYPPMPDAKRVLQPRKYTIAWESAAPSLI